MRFVQSVFGRSFGQVTDIQITYKPEEDLFIIPVFVETEPGRIEGLTPETAKTREEYIDGMLFDRAACAVNEAQHITQQYGADPTNTTVAGYSAGVKTRSPGANRSWPRRRHPKSRQEYAPDRLASE